MRLHTAAPAYPPRSVWSLRRVRQDPIGFLQSLAVRGDIVPFSLGRQSAFLLNHPAHIEQVLVSQHETFVKGHAFERVKRLLGNGLLTAERQLHRRRRQVILPAFHREHTDRYGELMVAYAARLRAEWRRHDSVDVADQMRRLTLAIVCKALFGVELDEVQAQEVREALGDAIASLDPLVSLLAPMRKVRPARERLHAVVEHLIGRGAGSVDGRENLLSLLLHVQAAEGDTAPDQLRDDVLTILLAGHDTIANGLTWTWLLLADHPQVEQRLHHELSEVVGARLPETADLARLTYARAVFAESLRLFPPAWVMARRALREHHVDTTAIPAGSLVIMSQYLVHRDPRFFREPLVFDPARWLSERQGSRPKLSYFPFGAGPRSCIGEAFAWMEGVLLLATLTQQWRLRPATAGSVEIDPRITLRPRPHVQMRLVPRSLDRVNSE